MTVVPCDSALGRRELVLGNPCPALRPHVRGYCGYFESAADLAPRVELPSGSVGLIVGFGPQVGIACPRHRGGSTARVTSFVAGLHDSYALAETTGWQHGVQIDFTPLGEHMLLGAPMDSLANGVVELEEVLGPFAVRLAEQLYETVSWPARFDLLNAAIASRLAAARKPSPAVIWAWRRLTDTSGRLAIGALAADLGSSRQYLVTRFREEVGLPPKTLAWILRFQRAIRLLEDDGEARLTARSGHLSKTAAVHSSSVPGDPSERQESRMAHDRQDSAPNIFPEIVYVDAPAALEWLARAFGFVQGEVIEGPDGTIAHAEMHLGPETIMPKSPMPETEFAMHSPRALGGINQCLYVAVKDPRTTSARRRPAPRSS